MLISRDTEIKTSILICLDIYVCMKNKVSTINVIGEILTRNNLDKVMLWSSMIALSVHFFAKLFQGKTLTFFC